MASREEASRTRSFARASLAWLPFAAAAFCLSLWLESSGGNQPPYVPPSWHVPVGLAACLALPVVFISLVARAARDPERAPHDRIIGTYLVPR